MRKMLLPFSWLYAGITFLRNLLYDKGWFHSVSFDVPVICVGNITVGGTGKTPCIEYLIQLLRPMGQVGLVSRGYKRNTKGLVMAGADSGALDIGDEPFQIKQRFGDLPIVVCGNRVQGISFLLQNSTANMVLMDDGFQHRAVRAGLYVMMMDFNRPLWEDHPFPAGTLRESASGRRRAHILIVNKCPDSLSDSVKELYFRKLDLQRGQHLFFSRIRYGELIPFNHHTQIVDPVDVALAVSGIANPAPFHHYVRSIGNQVVEMAFGDHHHFSDDDLLSIETKFVSQSEVRKIVVITEKDAARLHNINLSQFSFAEHLYYLPIELEFLFNEQNKFDQLIKQYVGKN